MHFSMGIQINTHRFSEIQIFNISQNLEFCFGFYGNISDSKNAIVYKYI